MSSKYTSLYQGPLGKRYFDEVICASTPEHYIPRLDYKLWATTLVPGNKVEGCDGKVHVIKDTTHEIRYITKYNFMDDDELDKLSDEEWLSGSDLAEAEERTKPSTEQSFIVVCVDVEALCGANYSTSGNCIETPTTEENQIVCEACTKEHQQKQQNGK